MQNLSNRVVMITGPAGNLGQAVAAKLLTLDASLILVDRSDDRLPKMYPQLADTKEHFLATGVDVTNLESVEAMVVRALDHFGGIDGLVNTVGAFRAATPLHAVTLDVWDMMIKINATTTLLTSRCVIPAMVEVGKGSVVNIASRNALHGGANTAAYSAAKSAVIRITESLSEEVKASGVNVNCVLPGTIDTPQNRSAFPDDDYQTWVDPAEIANVIAFLLSEEASAIHGASIPVYGLS